MGLGFLGPLFMLGGGGGEGGQMSEVMREGHQEEVSSHPFRQLATVGWAKLLLLVRLHWPKLEKRFGRGCICGRGAQEKNKQTEGPHGAATAKSLPSGHKYFQTPSPRIHHRGRLLLGRQGV